MTAGVLIVYLVMCITYIQSYRACQAQDIDRSSFPYVGYFQPYCAYLGVVVMLLVVLFYGYKAFDLWNVETFFQNYTMQIVAPVLCLGWKLVKLTRAFRPQEIDLVWERPFVDAYESQFMDPAPGFWRETLQSVSFGRPGR